MIVKQKQLLALGLAVAFVAAVGGVQAALAVSTEATGFSATAKTAGFTSAMPITRIVGQLINAALALVGTILLALIIYAGFLWMTAQGADERVKKAKAILSNAIIGMFIVFGSYSLSSYIFETVYTTATVERGAGVNTGLQGCLDVCNQAANPEDCVANCNERDFAKEAADEAAANAKPSPEAKKACQDSCTTDSVLDIDCYEACD